jgi:hypothetical protein
MIQWSGPLGQSESNSGAETRDDSDRLRFVDQKVLKLNVSMNFTVELNQKPIVPLQKSPTMRLITAEAEG